MVSSSIARDRAISVRLRSRRVRPVVRDGAEDRRVVGRAGAGRAARSSAAGTDSPRAAQLDHPPQRLDVLVGVQPVAGRGALGGREAVALLPHADRAGGKAGLLRHLSDRQSAHPASVYGRRRDGSSRSAHGRTRRDDATPIPSSSPVLRATSARTCSPRSPGAGHDVRALTRDPRRPRLPDGTDVRRGDALSGDGLDDGARGLPHRLLPDPHHGRRTATRTSPTATAAPPRTFADRRQARRGRSASIYLGGLGGDESTPSTCARRNETAKRAGRARPAARARARGDGDRDRQRLLRDRPPPGRPPAVDDRAALGGDAHPARRDRGRRQGADRRRRGRRRPGRGPARRRRRADVP